LYIGHDSYLVIVWKGNKFGIALIYFRQGSLCFLQEWIFKPLGNWPKNECGNTPRYRLVIYCFDSIYIYIYISFWFKMKSISFIKPDHRRIYIYIYKECVGLSAAWKMSIINGCEGMTANGLLVVNRWTTCILETTVYKTSSWKANYIILETQVTNCKTKSEWQSRKHTILQKDMGDKLSTLIWLHEHIWYI
jgi:hypothetical protein